VSPLTRHLSLQILQVTSLSITFTLAYEPLTLATPTPPHVQFSTSTGSYTTQIPGRITATTPLTAHHSKASRTRRKKATRKAAQPTRSAQVSSGSDLDDNQDGDDSSTTAVESDHTPSGSAAAISRVLASRRDDSLTNGSGLDGRPHFATLLSRGLAVTVNGSPWRSVAAHVGEGVDEAVVVVYGLR
jgi:hypothetical protein